MKKYTNAILAAVYGLGVAAMIITLLIIRFRIDRMVELTV